MTLHGLSFSKRDVLVDGCGAAAEQGASCKVPTVSRTPNGSREQVAEGHTLKVKSIFTTELHVRCEKEELSGTISSVIACKMVSKKAIHQDGKDRAEHFGREEER